MKAYSINGYYGSNHTETEVFCVAMNGGTWYVCDGGQTVNFTYDSVQDGTDVETLSDTDCFTTEPIYGLSELENAINA